MERVDDKTLKRKYVKNLTTNYFTESSSTLKNVHIFG